MRGEWGNRGGVSGTVRSVRSSSSETPSVWVPVTKIKVGALFFKVTSYQDTVGPSLSSVPVAEPDPSTTVLVPWSGGSLVMDSGRVKGTGRT